MSETNLSKTNFADRARAANDAAVAAWNAAETAAFFARRKRALCAPLSNKERCDAQRRNCSHGEPFIIKGGFQVSVRVAFFDRRGAFVRTEQSDDCTWEGDAPSKVITARRGDAFARIETVRYGNGGRVYVRVVSL